MFRSDSHSFTPKKGSKEETVIVLSEKDCGRILSIIFITASAFRSNKSRYRGDKSEYGLNFIIRIKKEKKENKDGFPLFY